MNVLVIPEDARKDQFILRPIIRAMFRWKALTRAKVEICLDPILGGIVPAMRLENLISVVRARPMVDLFIHCVDRDAEPGRRDALDQLEREIQQYLRPHQHFLSEHAWQELEVWALAGMDLPPEWQWTEVRLERNAKEVYFAPMSRKNGWDAEDDGGRRRMAEAAAIRYKRVRARCPEDVVSLESRLDHDPT